MADPISLNFQGPEMYDIILCTVYCTYGSNFEFSLFYTHRFGRSADRKYGVINSKCKICPEQMYSRLIPVRATAFCRKKF